MSELNASNLRKEQGNEGPDLVGVTELTSPYFMVPPSGTTAERPQNPQKGTLRFNTDIGSLEYFKGDGLGWESIDRVSPDLNGGARGVYGPGEAPAGDSMDYITISTLGNSVDFGNLTQDRRSGGIGGASRTRGLFAAGQNPSPFTFYNTIDYITFSTVGNAINFADLLNTTYDNMGTSDSTRGLINYGTKSGFTMVNTIEYITMSSVGTNAQDFGDLSQLRMGCGACSSSTRALWGGGSSPGGTPRNTVDYNTISSLGNAIDFGNLVANYANTAGGSNSVRGLFSLGEGQWGTVNTIDYFTIATLGNAVDFGDRSQAAHKDAAVTSPTRLVFGGGSVSPAYTNVMEYVQIMTTGNAVDFGDLTSARRAYGAVSNAHGGL